MDFRINVTTRQDRYEATGEIERVLEESGGFILDHHLYSNISTVLNIELPSLKLQTLVDRIASLGANVMFDQQRALVRGIARGTLQITFVHNDPDIRHEVPAVPG